MHSLRRTHFEKELIPLKRGKAVEKLSISTSFRQRIKVGTHDTSL